MLKIYHYPRCRVSRAGMQVLIDKKVDFEIRKYITEPLSVEEIKILLTKLNLPASEVIRTSEEVYKKKFKNKKFNNDEWISIMIEFPKLIKRPIIESDYKAVIGEKKENIINLL
ncbi:MAG: ArsC/Spx/MgsR family protein [Bacteroidota bacterium]|nr:ArsC/Spx/MgsR family protein [Bacteroidota bacterium]